MWTYPLLWDWDWGSLCDWGPFSSPITTATFSLSMAGIPPWLARSLNRSVALLKRLDDHAKRSWLTDTFKRVDKLRQYQY
jgi:hypothetical protein